MQVVLMALENLSDLINSQTKAKDTKFNDLLHFPKKSKIKPIKTRGFVNSTSLDNQPNFL